MRIRIGIINTKKIPGLKKGDKVWTIGFYADGTDAAGNQPVCIKPLPSKKKLDEISTESNMRDMKETDLFPGYPCTNIPKKYIDWDKKKKKKKKKK